MPCPLIIRLSDGSGIVWDAAAHDLTNYLVGNYPPNYPVPSTKMAWPSPYYLLGAILQLRVFTEDRLHDTSS